MTGFVRLRRRGQGIALDLVRSTRTAAGPRQQFVASLGRLHPARSSARELLDRARIASPPGAAAGREGSGRPVAVCRPAAPGGGCGDLHAEHPRPRLASLQGCSVGPVDPGEARTLIRSHEWLRTTSRARIYFGLRDPVGDVLAVVGFGHGPHAAGQGGALVLESDAPANAGTFLIGRALRLLRKLGWRRFKAYSDPAAGETGVIYRALAWRPASSRHGKPWRYTPRGGTDLFRPGDLRAPRHSRPALERTELK